MTASWGAAVFMGCSRPSRIVHPHARGLGSAAVVATRTALRIVLPSSANTSSARRA
ncbi:hypothetical protein ACQPXT_40600 [Streptomyces sp. CA-100214]